MSANKLPSELAFPISVTKLKERLSSVPQLSEVEINYLYYKGMILRRRKRPKAGTSAKVLDSCPRRIIEAAYVRRAISLGTPNASLADDSRMNVYNKHRWTIDLRTIQKTSLAKVRLLLDEEGYKKLNDWFIEKNRYAGEIGTHNLTIAFDGNRLTYRQSDGF